MDKEARNAYLAKWREANRGKTRAAQHKYYAANKDKCKVAVASSVAKKREHYTAKSIEWQKANPDKVKDIRKRGYIRNREAEIRRVRTRTGKIRHGKLWTTPAQQMEIDGLYLFTECFPWFEVDHIVPLTHERVCGLHVLNNLQVLTRKENRAKRNKFCPAVVELNPYLDKRG